MSKPIAIIIEPDHLWRQILFRHLDHAGASFLFAPNAGSARRLVDRYEPGLVVTELVLPDYSGLELIRKIRQRPLPIRILVLSRDFDRASMEQGLGYGVSAYIEKGALPVKGIAAAILSALDG